MDCLFSKYGSPFTLLDELISNGMFFDWVLEFVNSENEKQIYEVWLHKIFNKSYEEFKQSILQNDEINEEQIETTISNSANMLNNFIPECGVKNGTF